MPYLVFILKHKYRRVWCIKYGAEVSFFVRVLIETVSNNKVILFAQQKNHFFSKSTLTMAKTCSLVKKAAEKRKKAPRKKKIKEDLKIEGYLDLVEKVDVDVEKTDAEIKAMNALDISKEYFNKARSLCERFLNEPGLIGEYFYRSNDVIRLHCHYFFLLTDCCV